jgi:hypothetical protein
MIYMLFGILMKFLLTQDGSFINTSTMEVQCILAAIVILALYSMKHLESIIDVVCGYQLPDTIHWLAQNYM